MLLLFLNTNIYIGNTSVWLSAAAYCDSKTYLSRSYKGYSSGFVATYSISNVLNDVQVEYYDLMPSITHAQPTTVSYFILILIYIYLSFVTFSYRDSWDIYHRSHRSMLFIADLHQ